MSKQCSLLQILVATILLSVSAALKRYPDPFDCQKYYTQIPEKGLALHSCPNNWYFNQVTELCQSTKPTFRSIAFSCPCTADIQLEYCCTTTTFKYCAPGGITIVDNGNCPDNTCNCPLPITC